MIYPNTREGRDRIIDEINSLTKQGYKRKDVANKCVVLQKQLGTKGKVCNETEVVSYVFVPDNAKIIKRVMNKSIGIERAKSMLFGWNSPKIEVANGVKAGMFNDGDLRILKQHYGNKWESKGG